MNPDSEVLKKAASLLDSGEPFVLMTVVRTQGSTPRNPGARMLWRPSDVGSPNGGLGTIGGGQFELLVLDAARACIEKRGNVLERFVLGADADQCCGGVVEVFLEYHGRAARVVVFGAGHVAHALAPLLTHSGLEVVIVDDRPEWCSGERFPAARRVCNWESGIAACRERGVHTLAVVMTCSHDTDLRLLRGLLEDPPAFVGLIGSRTKRACLFGRLVASGIDDTAVARVRCPIGVGDTGKEPHAVAISIAAQLLIEAKAAGDSRPAGQYTASAASMDD